MGDSRTRLLAVTAAVGLTPVALYYGRCLYRKYRHYRWGYQPGAISGYFARVLGDYSQKRRNDRPVRVYMDGCFDMMHYGHANALRQARACGDVLVVGLIPDEEIIKVKGPPVMNNEERRAMVASVKWVDEIIDDTPYEITENFMAELFDKHNIDFIVHGDDPCLLPDGTDAYKAAKDVGRFVTIKRTEGVSTTDLVGRMLMCVKPPVNITPRSSQQQLLNFSATPGSPTFNSPTPERSAPQGEASGESTSTATPVYQFLPTSRRFVQFSSGLQPPPGATVVFIDGAFDMFHAGHVSILQRAKARGDFLLVGLHTDDSIAEARGRHHPIQTLHERALSVLACRYVDEVVMGTPQTLTKDLITTFNIGLVVQGSVQEPNPFLQSSGDPYAVAKEMGIFELVASPRSMTTSTIVDRIVANRGAFEQRNARKAASEAAYYQDKAFVGEI